jgi:Mg-chelatase subunit ChlD
MHMLEDDDRVALIVFADKAKIIFPLTNMTEISKIKCQEELFKLNPYGPTNIWDGLFNAMEVLREDNSVEFGNVERRKAVMLLTDGVPNREPNHGYVEGIRNYMDQYPKFKFQLNTFGFGYKLKSDLLLDLAQEGNGTYAFIPVAPNVGTVFVNSIANILSTYTSESSLRLVA